MGHPGRSAGRIRAGAIALGVVADKLTFVVAAGLLSTWFSTTSSAFSVVALALGFGCTTLGAFVAAVRAGRLPVRHGLAVALVGFVISFARFVAFAIAPPSDPGAVHSLPWEILGWVLVFGAGFTGGELGRRRLATAASRREPTGRP